MFRTLAMAAVLALTCLGLANCGLSQESEPETSRASLVAASKADKSQEVAQLLAFAAKSTPGAIASTREQYARLLQKRGDSLRLRTLGALVLIEQHRYTDAIATLGDVREHSMTGVDARRLVVWACLLGKKYSDTLAAMESLAAEIRKVNSDGSSADDDELQRAAMFLGQVVGFLEGPRRGLIDEQQLASTRDAIVTSIGPAFEASFEEGRSDVGGRFDQWSKELQQLKSETAAQRHETAQQAHADLLAKQADLSNNEAKQANKTRRLQNDAETLAKIDSDSKTAKDAFDVLQARITVVRSQITDLRATQQNGRGPDRSVAGGEIRELNSTLAQLNSQLADLGTQVQAMNNRREKLLSNGQRESQQLAQRDAEMRKQKKLIHHAEKQLAQAKPVESSPEVRTLSGQIVTFTSYEEFPFERDAERMRKWFE